ncbi:MAG: hypothetical protein [Siphoviridae sp. ctjeG17]|nr:MAG: hypothetical protein [Siphoviridae sp. ctjeG17]
MKLLNGILITLLLIGGVTAASINLIQESKKITLGVQVDELYYVVKIDGRNVEKIELNGQDEVEYKIITTKSELSQFIIVYGQLSPKERVQYINEHFQLPPDLMLSLAGEYMKEQ